MGHVKRNDVGLPLVFKESLGDPFVHMWYSVFTQVCDACLCCKMLHIVVIHLLRQAEALRRFYRVHNLNEGSLTAFKANVKMNSHHVTEGGVPICEGGDGEADG